MFKETRVFKNVLDFGFVYCPIIIIVDDLKFSNDQFVDQLALFFLVDVSCNVPVSSS